MAEGGGERELGKAANAMDSSEIVNTEDVVQALMDYLVDPVLPGKSSARDNPSLSQHQSVAKQMHAVVLLYNYYHRRQFPQLEFLDFESFCKVAVIAKPTLLVHMKFMQGCNDEVDDLDKQLSITEKVIMDACNICVALDASKDVPSTEGWTVSKVTVFLIDSMQKNCLLLFSSITQGVWSLIENDLDDFNPLSKGMLETKNTNKKKKITKKPPRDELNAEEAGFQQLAFSAVKEKTDINQTDLMLLESHVVYSISKEKTVSRFYLMRCTTPINEDVIQVPIKDAINSLHGPLVKKSFGSYIVTQAVEYFHLLPYAGIVSDWLSRKEFPNSSSLLQLGLGEVNMDCSPMGDNACTIEIKESSSDISNGTFQTAHVFDSKTSSTITETVNQKENGEYCIYGSSDASCKPHVMAEGDSSIVFPESGQKKEYFRYSSSQPSYTNAFCRPGSMAEKDSSIACPPSTNVSKNISRIVQTNHLEGMMMSCEVDLNVFRSSSKDKVEMVDPVMKPCSTKSIGVKNASGNDSCNIGLANLNETPMKDLLALKGDEVLQTALRVLQKKRDDLSQQQRNLEDEIARCEKNLQTILSGDKDDLMLKMESIIEACNIACSRGATQTHGGTHLHLEKQWSPQSMKRRKLSEAILNLQNPCQELDAICNENNWILPRFSVFPLNGGYRASVTVQGFDFECPCGGDIRADPSEARESAATHMLRKLRSMASEAQ